MGLAGKGGHRLCTKEVIAATKKNGFIFCNLKVNFIGEEIIQVRGSGKYESNGDEGNGR